MKNKKTRFAFFPSRSIGQDLRVWLNNLFPEEWMIYFIARKPMLMTGYIKNIIPVDMYTDATYKIKVTDEDIKKEEKWLGVSFNSIIYSEYLYFHTGKFKAKKKWKKNIVRHIRFFRKFLKENEINFCTVGYPAEITDIVFFYVVKRMEIPYFDSFMPFTLSDNIRYVCFKDNIPLKLDKVNYNKHEINKAYAQIRKNLFSRTFFLPEVQELSRLNLGFSLNTIKYKWDQLKEIKINVNPHESQFNIVEMTLIYLREWWNSRSTSSLLEQPRENEKYFYLPLHRRRDAAITFKAPLEVRDQLKFTKVVSKCLPSGIKLYIKGHPHYLGSDFARKELKKLKKLKNVRIIDYKVNNMALIQNSLGVVTINSTTGYEAIVLGKPLITFGNEYYTLRGGVCISASINNLIKLRNVFAGVVRNPFYGINIEKRKKFIYEYYKCSFPLGGHVFVDVGQRMKGRDFEIVKEKTRKAAQIILNN